MKIKSRKSLYFFIPLGLIIKLAITIILLNLPGGCREEKDKGLPGADCQLPTAIANCQLPTTN